jgi:predicted permease
MSFDHLRRDLRSAVRNLVRAPGFAIVTILTLALGIGANTAIFSVVRGVILRPLGYPNPEQLLFLTSRFPALGFDQFWVSPPEYFEISELSQSFSVIGAFTTSEVNLAALDRPRRVASGAVNAELLEALAVPPHAGRWFTRDETRANGPDVVMLSHEIWHSAFGGRDLIGQTVDVNGVRREVVGIMPPRFDVMDNGVQVWLPLRLNPENRQNRGNHYLYLIGRLREGVTVAEAQTELRTLMANWGERTGVSSQHVYSLAENAHAMQMEPLQEEIVGSASRAIWVLQGAVGFVLLIACANLANLLLARASTRQREFAVRLALGAGRGRLIAQFLTEGILLALLGAALGLALAYGGVRAVMTAFPDSLPRAVDIAVDPVVLLFTLGVAVATGAVFGLAPLLSVSQGGVAHALKEGGARGSTGARHYVRRALVTAEVALAVLLVVGAGLMLRTVVNLLNVDAGFDRSRLVTFSLDVPGATYSEPVKVHAFHQRIQREMAAIPGVQGVTLMRGLPPQRQVDANDTDIEGYTAPPEGPFENVDYYQVVADSYFETMGIPIVEGRGFVPGDADGAPVTVINETMARTFWPDRSPLGARVMPSTGTEIWMTIVGVAKDVKQGGVDQKTGTEIYFHEGSAVRHVNYAPSNMHVVLRTSLPVETLAPSIEAVVRSADATLPIIRLRAMDEVFSESLNRPRLIASLLGVFAGLAPLLAAVGTYGVLSYMVTERRREIGIRMALGAARGRVLRLVMSQGLTLAGIGAALGIAGSLALTRLMESLLFGVQPSDPLTLATVIAAIGVIATIACVVPAHRATRVDPVVVLRDE